tara:strand:- start:5191 stop:6555 length:1365 start_codon:yes stop_codon:yes gene_type:complete
MSTIINARSPYYIKVEPVSGTLSSASMSLYIYSGTFTTDKPASATYTISKDIIGTNNYVIYEVTELIRDYLITEYGAYSIDGVWVEADITLTKTSGSETQNYDFLAFDGYGYFEDGVNPRTSTNPAVTKISSTATGTTAYKLIDSTQTFTKTVSVGDTITNTTDTTTTIVTGIDSDTQLAVRATNFIESGDSYTIADTGNYTPQYLQSNTKIYFKKGRDIVFPVFAEAEGTVAFTTGGDADVFWNQVDEFWNLYDVNWSNVLTPITIGDTNVSEDKIVYIRLTPTTDLNTGDVITISTTKSNYTQSVTITLEEVCEPKYDFLDVVFYNKFGALQIMPFHKKSMISMDSNSESYKRNLMDFVNDPTYNKEKHSVRQFQVTGKEKIQMNTGFIDESFNEVIKQLMLSEQVWVYDGTEVKPIILDTKSLQFKTSLNDKLINYTFDFSYAFNKVNDIR